MQDHSRKIVPTLTSGDAAQGVLAAGSANQCSGQQRGGGDNNNNALDLLTASMGVEMPSSSVPGCTNTDVSEKGTPETAVGAVLSRLSRLFEDLKIRKNINTEKKEKEERDEHTVAATHPILSYPPTTSTSSADSGLNAPGVGGFHTVIGESGEKRGQQQEATKRATDIQRDDARPDDDVAATPTTVDSLVAFWNGGAHSGDFEIVTSDGEAEIVDSDSDSGPDHGLVDSSSDEGSGCPRWPPAVRARPRPRGGVDNLDDDDSGANFFHTDGGSDGDDEFFFCGEVNQSGSELPMPPGDLSAACSMRPSPLQSCQALVQETLSATSVSRTSLSRTSKGQRRRQSELLRKRSHERRRSAADEPTSTTPHEHGHV